MNNQITDRSHLFKEHTKRYYVYIGPACNEFAQYDDLTKATHEHPGEFIFDTQSIQVYLSGKVY